MKSVTVSGTAFFRLLGEPDGGIIKKANKSNSY
jgi:hypothetical protein